MAAARSILDAVTHVGRLALLLTAWFLAGAGLGPLPATTWEPPRVLASARAGGPPGARTPGFLGAPERIADGIDLYRVDGTGLTRPASPQSIRLLRLDPRRVRLDSALATGEIPGRATVRHIAQRAGALAAVNAGFFSPAGDPTGVLKIAGRLLSDTRRARGAVALVDAADRQQVLFDQVSARVRLRFRTGRTWNVVPFDGVDTARGPGRLVLFSSASGATTDTTGGLEWTLAAADGGGVAGRAPTWRAATPARAGNSAIPADGHVVSYGGQRAPAPLASLDRATAVQLRESLVVRSGQRVRDWLRARTIVGGAGLLVRAGEAVTDWTVEQLSNGFETTRHPRTVIARDRNGATWLIVVDGRQPDRALGMTFAEMQDLLARLDVTDALNLDGGGSTTMVVRDEVVNRPSDLTGPRAVSDALVVTARLRPVGVGLRPTH